MLNVGQAACPAAAAAWGTSETALVRICDGAAAQRVGSIGPSQRVGSIRVEQHGDGVGGRLEERRLGRNEVRVW